jgi:16S rRNA (uracil1498-N3)-methyltransferase
VARRFHVERVQSGRVTLDRASAHHAKKVLRLQSGDAVELFDDAGNVGAGTILPASGNAVFVQVDSVAAVTESVAPAVHIASAVPKGSRADWMIEKLSELGVARFTPLATERAVVLPEGAGKRGRWERIAEEAARQSARAGVMRIDPLTPLDRMLAGPPGVFGSTRPPAEPLTGVLARLAAPPVVLIGPEGGWSEGEVDRLARGGWTAVTLGRTILRVETAAMAAAVVATMIRNAPND